MNFKVQTVLAVRLLAKSQFYYADNSITPAEYTHRALRTYYRYVCTCIAIILKIYLCVRLFLKTKRSQGKRKKQYLFIIGSLKWKSRYYLHRTFVLPIPRADPT